MEHLPVLHDIMGVAYVNRGDMPNLGASFWVNPMDILSTRTAVQGGLINWQDLGVEDAWGSWKVCVCQAMATCTLGNLVTDYEATITGSAGTTTTIVGQIAAIATVDILKNGFIRKTLDNGATAAEEGKHARITANTDLSTSGTITFTPAFGEANAASDVCSVWTPYRVVPTPGNVFARGVALATATVGQYFFVLQRGIYFRGVIAADDDLVHGCELMAGAAGIFVKRAGDTIPSVGISMTTRNTSDSSTSVVVEVRCG